MSSSIGHLRIVIPIGCCLMNLMMVVVLRWIMMTMMVNRMMGMMSMMKWMMGHVTARWWNSRGREFDTHRRMTVHKCIQHVFFFSIIFLILKKYTGLHSHFQLERSTWDFVGLSGLGACKFSKTNIKHNLVRCI